MSNFTKKEKRKFLFHKYLREHIFDLFVDILINVAFVLFIMFISKGEEHLLGLILVAAIYSIVRFIYNFYRYNKKHLL